MQNSSTWTAARCKKHNLQDDDSCILCRQEPETITHLLIRCSYTRQIWHLALSKVSWEVPTPSPSPEDHCLAAWWTRSRKRVDKADRKTFDSMVLLISWCIWLERNCRTFNSTEKNVVQLIQTIIDKASLWVAARFNSLAPLTMPTSNSNTDVGREIISL